MKDKLIKAWEITCANLEIPRSNEYYKLKDEETPHIKFPDIECFKKSRSCYSDGICWSTVFKFGEIPNLVLVKAYEAYYTKYKRYFLIHTPDKEELIKKAEKHSVEEDFYIDTFDRTIKFTVYKRFLIHGTICSELTDDEFESLKKLFMDSITKYDESKLEKRCQHPKLK